VAYIKCTGYGRCYKAPVACVKQHSILFGGDDVCDWIYAIEVLHKGGSKAMRQSNVDVL